LERKMSCGTFTFYLHLESVVITLIVQAFVSDQ
jgi:hypothetical protein